MDDFHQVRTYAAPYINYFLDFSKIFLIKKDLPQLDLLVDKELNIVYILCRSGKHF